VLLATREIGELPLVVRVLAGPRTQARTLHSPRSANVLGKLATTFELATVVALLVRAPGRRMLIAVTAAVGAASAISYWIREARAREPGRARLLLAARARPQTIAYAP
jgi:hypothetical protein